jgi:hypothetical protein
MIKPSACGSPDNALLQDLLDGSLDPTTAGRVSGHAAMCEVCGAELGELRAIDRALRSAHLTPTEVVEAGWGDVPAADPHLALCSACREEVAAVRGARPEEGGRSRQPPRGWAAPLALAATVVLAVGLVIRDRSAPPSEGGQSGPSTRRGEVVQIGGLTPRGEISRAAAELVFSWQGSPESRYSVSFFSVAGRRLIRLEVTGTRVALSADDRARLQSEPAFFWKVEATVAGAPGTSSLERVAWRP